MKNILGNSSKIRVNFLSIIHYERTYSINMKIKAMVVFLKYEFLSTTFYVAVCNSVSVEIFLSDLCILVCNIAAEG